MRSAAARATDVALAHFRVDTSRLDHWDDLDRQRDQNWEAGVRYMKEYFAR